MITQLRPTRQSRTRRLFVSTVLIAGLAVIGSGCQGLGPKIHHQQSVVVSHIAGSALSIESSNGSIIAGAYERADVGIEVDLYGRELERLMMAVVHAERESDDTLSIWVEWPGRRQNGEGASVVIEIPDASGVEAHSSNGRISITGLSGHAVLKTSNGSITVTQHDGSVFADTSNGSLKAEHVSGEIEMYSSNGKVIITDAFGPIQAETSNGNMYISTMDGNEGPIRARTSNGRAILDLGDGFAGILKCQTSNGKVSVDGIEGADFTWSSKGYIELQIGDSTEVSAIKTSNGSVRVQRRHTEPSDG